MEKWKLIGCGSEEEYHFVKKDKISNKLILLSIVSTNILGNHYNANKYAIFLESYLYNEINSQNEWIRNALLKIGYLEPEFECFFPEELISITRNYYGYDKDKLICILNTLEEISDIYEF